MQEELFEEGIVLKSRGGIAEIVLKENAGCEECSAKIFCSPKENALRTLKVLDSFETQPGDEVKISIKGSEIFKASILLYGIPLVLLLAGILLGINLFDNSTYPELYGFLTGFTFLSIYFSIFYIISSNIKAKETLPRIISSKTSH